MIKEIIRSIGYIILDLIPKGTLIHHVQHIFDKRNSSLFVSFLRGYFSECYKTADSDEQKRIGFLLWRSKAATHYFKNRTPSELIIDRFHSVIKKFDGYLVCEIGTGNGYLVNALSQRSTYSNFIGLDLNNEQIQINKRTYTDNNKLDFICGDINDYIRGVGLRETVYISYVSLTTFTLESVNELFELIAKKPVSSVLVLYEPVEPDVAKGNRSSLRSDMAYGHNYITLAKKNGFDTLSYDHSGSFLWFACKKKNGI
ncbi:MAG: class I SAM-dependent methyltransferase [Candidatus Omnitrophica bacterium]|nr:class I SAM-dependent methyltransferase [Candidatus Omnitrophota bacterium]